MKVEREEKGKASERVPDCRSMGGWGNEVNRGNGVRQ